MRVAHTIVMLAALLQSALAFGWAIHGNVTDANGDPVRGIIVEVWNTDAYWGDAFVGTSYTNDQGDFWYGGLDTGANPYVIVTWEMWLNAPYQQGAPNYDDHVIRLKDNQGVAYTTKTSDTTWNITTGLWPCQRRKRRWRKRYPWRKLDQPL